MSCLLFAAPHAETQADSAVARQLWQRLPLPLPTVLGSGRIKGRRVWDRGWGAEVGGRGNNPGRKRPRASCVTAAEVNVLSPDTEFASYLIARENT